MPFRRILALPAALLLVAIPAIASAHAELASSTPAAGANLDSPPTKVTLTFSGDANGELDPSGSSFTVTDAAGKNLATGQVDLSVADRNVMTADVSISEPGVYTVKWTSKSSDGASLSGSFSFGYKASAAIPEPSGGHEHETPNTSVAPSGNGAPLAPMGFALIGLALGLLSLGVRRSRVAARS
jgi:methionine-rich copper-binding protein CopC